MLRDQINTLAIVSAINVWCLKFLDSVVLFKVYMMQSKFSAITFASLGSVGRSTAEELNESIFFLND